MPFNPHTPAQVREMLERFPNELRIVWKDFPLPMHAHAEGAAVLARRAATGPDWKPFFGKPRIPAPDCRARTMALVPERGAPTINTGRHAAADGLVWGRWDVLDMR